MRYFIDFEFDEDGRTIEPISLGIARDLPNEQGGYYMEFAFDVDKVARTNPWVWGNVLPLLTWEPAQRFSKEQARDEILRIIGNDPEPEFWGYYCDYDWVVFCQLFGRMVELPDHFPRICMDVHQMAKMLRAPKMLRPPKSAREHNALVDALWIRDFYRVLAAYERSDQ